MEENLQEYFNFIIKKLDLTNVESYSLEIKSKGFWDDQYYDYITLRYKQWWKFNKKLVYKRKQRTTISPNDCDSYKVHHKHSDPAAKLKTALQYLKVPEI